MISISWKLFNFWGICGASFILSSSHIPSSQFEKKTDIFFVLYHLPRTSLLKFLMKILKKKRVGASPKKLSSMFVFLIPSLIGSRPENTFLFTFFFPLQLNESTLTTLSVIFFSYNYSSPIKKWLWNSKSLSEVVYKHQKKGPSQWDEAFKQRAR